MKKQGKRDGQTFSTLGPGTSLNALAAASIPTHPVLQLLLKEVVIMHCQISDTASVAAVAVTLHSSGQEGGIPSGPSRESCDVVASGGATCGRAKTAAAAVFAYKNVK